MDADIKGLCTRTDVAPPSATPYGMQQLTLDDSDGYGLCVQERVATA